ncbi:MAG: glycosyltransferase [Megasphaera massiliensis]|uniref:glycosyltransferase n=1 Tax=Megasphaera massiliensis TaxID=1232428 RepID=UPI002108EBAC|nr:glycosyltransferase [Megasphaera massiliensis]MCQ5211348.1 glycosyltransferase [Megasphaera massiliensis]MEE0658111.1 glycosyltransferase [Megasphaera massiliensis]
MRVAILETVKTQGGFEQEFDRLIIDELKKEGHEPVLYLPENSSLPVDFGIPIEYMSGGEIVDYEGAGKLKKIWLSIQREQRRVRWFDAAYEKACRHEVDAIILTTATYRYLRSLHKSKLKESPVPVIFIFLGVNPHEKPKFLKQARRCEGYQNIKLKITSLRNDFTEDHVSKIEIIPPPVLLPQGVSVTANLTYHEPVRIGFFGHYRKGEKDIDGIIQAFLDSHLEGKAELIVQAAPTGPEDADDMERIMEKYSRESAVRFIKGKVLGMAWYDLLQSVDVLFLPYSNERYLYNWSAVYFNALALYKPVLATAVLNPEMLKNYTVGQEVDLQDLGRLRQQLGQFLQSYEEMLPMYEAELKRVNHDFSTAAFLENVLK